MRDLRPEFIVAVSNAGGSSAKEKDYDYFLLGVEYAIRRCVDIARDRERNSQYIQAQAQARLIRKRMQSDFGMEVD